MHIVSSGYHLYEMSDPTFRGKQDKNIIKLSSNEANEAKMQAMIQLSLCRFYRQLSINTLEATRIARS